MWKVGRWKMDEEVAGSRFKIQDSKFKVQGLRCKVLGVRL